MSEASDSKKNVIIPVFVSHMGCPFECIFCDQRKISGQKEEMTVGKMAEIVESHLATIKPGTHVEIGFYGGSFTGIPLAAQTVLLEKGQEYVRSGKIQGIRLSTRPDYIDEKILNFIKSYDVNLIELGVQSLDDEVLKHSCRGHSQAESIKAFEHIKASGIKLGIQTMIGLPGDTFDKSVSTANKVISFNPDTVRIYPTLVIKGTGLEEMYKAGVYKPLTLGEAVDLSAVLLKMYNDNNINVIRIGLQPTAELNECSEVAAGPFHPAFRHLVESRLMRTKIIQKLEHTCLQPKLTLKLLINPRNISEAAGHKRENIEYLKDHCGIQNIKIIPDNRLKPFEVEFIE